MGTGIGIVIFFLNYPALPLNADRIGQYTGVILYIKKRYHFVKYMNSISHICFVEVDMNYRPFMGQQRHDYITVLAGGKNKEKLESNIISE